MNIFRPVVGVRRRSIQRLLNLKNILYIFIKYVTPENIKNRNKSGFFGGPAFIRPIRAIEKVFKKF